MKNKKNLAFAAVIVTLSLAGAIIRYLGLPYEGVDYRDCLRPWFDALKANGSLHGLAEYKGDYNMFYVTMLYFLTKIPVSSLFSIKMLSILFDYLTATLIFFMIQEVAPEGKKRLYGCIGYGIALVNPAAAIDSAYLAQCESIWAFFSLFSFWLFWKHHPAWGSFVFGLALAMKPQGIFILPIILIYYCKEKSFSVFHLLWSAAGIQLTCVPAILGGCGFDIFIRRFLYMMGRYPHVYYYYPNIWTYLKNAPYYVYGKVAIFSTFTALLLFMVLFLKSKKKAAFQEMLEYAAWTAMTCGMLLPCMHERYNYLGEVLFAVSAIINKRYRFPALLLLLVSAQCYGQSYLSWPWISHYVLAAINIIIYIYLTLCCTVRLYKGGFSEKGLENA